MGLSILAGIDFRPQEDKRATCELSTFKF